MFEYFVKLALKGLRTAEVVNCQNESYSLNDTLECLVTLPIALHKYGNIIFNSSFSIVAKNHLV